MENKLDSSTLSPHNETISAAASHEDHRSFSSPLDDAAVSDAELFPAKELLEELPSLTEAQHLYQSAVKEKNELFSHIRTQIAIGSQIVELFSEEETARRTLIGSFTSCTSPTICSHLRYRPNKSALKSFRFNALCLLSCIVDSEYTTVVQAPLLATREGELSRIFSFFKLESVFWGVRERLLHDEERKFRALVGYHRFSLKWAASWWREPGAQEFCETHHMAYELGNWEEESNAEEGESGTESQEEIPGPPTVDTTALGVPEENPRNSSDDVLVVGSARSGSLQPYEHFDSIQGRHNFMRTIIGNKDSPFCSYLFFLDIQIVTTAETEDRECIEREEQRILSFLHWSFFNDHAEEIEELEELAQYGKDILVERERFERGEIQKTYFETLEHLKRVAATEESRKEELERKLRLMHEWVFQHLKEHYIKGQLFLEVMRRLSREYLEELDVLAIVEEYNATPDKALYMNRVYGSLPYRCKKLSDEEQQEREVLEEDEEVIRGNLDQLQRYVQSYYVDHVLPIQQEEIRARSWINLFFKEWEQRSRIEQLESSERELRFNPSISSRKRIAMNSLSRLSTTLSTSDDETPLTTAEAISTNDLRYTIVNNLNCFVDSEEMMLLFLS